MSEGRLRRWLLAAVGLTFCLILIGGLVSATKSGMGCGPQWPLCNDRWIPRFSDRATVLEYSHRVVAGIVTIVVVTALFVARRRSGPVVRASLIAAVTLLVVQSLLGATTVWLDLPPAVSVLHLLTSQLFFATLITGLVGMVVGDGGGGRLTSARVVAPNLGSVPRLAAGAASVVLGTIVLGAIVKLNGAGLACGLDVPLCRGALVPEELDGTILLHWLHRLAALIAALVTAILFIQVLRAPWLPTLARRLAGAAFVLVLMQITLGVATVLTRLNPALSTAHLGVATLLFGTLVALWAWARLALRTRSLPGPIPGQPVRVGDTAVAGAQAVGD